MVNTDIPGKRLFVLDTNVLMHDPAAIYRFKEHDIFIPMLVLEELDDNKRGVSEVARNARQASRFLDDLLCDATADQIEAGLQLPQTSEAGSGRLFLQTRIMSGPLPGDLPGHRADNHILSTALALQGELHDKTITLVSKDINMRIKASALGIHSEDYYNDRVLDDVSLLFTGVEELPADFWETHDKEMDSWQEEGRTFYRLQGPLTGDWYPNECLTIPDGFNAIVREVDEDSATIEHARDYTQHSNAVWGVTARNSEQSFALNLLMDPDVDLVTLLGQAGTGKTLLTLAAGLAQTLDNSLYNEIIMTRVTIPMGEDIGFLPGTEEEKMTPWMGALMDNLEVLGSTQGSGDWEREATNAILHNRLKVRSINFMRGRTFLNKYIIVDEAQNLTSKQMKSLITRAGPGTKVVCLGNVAQIDSPYLSETTSGLTYIVDRFKNWPHSGHVTLRRGERSRLADYATDVL
ncbi:MAG: PhoH family protein [Granulosicoccaceae bacterium]|jgi:PhoH-like ATPase